MLRHWRTPIRFLRGNVRRSLLSIVSIALGVALVCGLDVVNRSVGIAFDEVIDNVAGRAALQVSAGSNGFFEEELATSIAAVDGVDDAVAVVTATAFAGNGEALTVHGVEVTSEAANRMYRSDSADGFGIKDSIEFLNHADSILATHAYAARMGLAIGSGLDLDTPNGRRRMTIRGLLEPSGVARVYGGNLIVMDLFAAQATFTETRLINRIDISLRRDADVETVRAAIARLLPSGLQVDTPAQRKVNLQAVMSSLRSLLRGVSLVGLVVAFLISFSRVEAVFAARIWQLGVMRALGLRTNTLWADMVKEGAILGIGGAVLGIPLGLLLGRILLPVVARTSALNYNLVAPEAVLSLHPQSLFLAFVLGVATTLLAASLPARRAARAAIGAILRSRGTDVRHTGAALATRTGVVFLIGALAAHFIQTLSRSALPGLIATGLILVAAALLAHPLVCWLLPALSALLRRLVGPTSRLAIAGLHNNTHRVALTAATLGIGLGSVVWLWTLAGSFERSVTSALGQALRADLVVSSVHIGSGFLESPLSEAVVNDVRGFEGVDAAAGWRALEWPYQNSSVGLSGYDSIYFLDRRFGEWPLIGASEPNVWESVAAGEAVVVSTSFVTNFGSGTGDQITLQTPSGALTLPIAGVTIDFVAPAGTIEMSRALLQRYWHDTAVTRVFVTTAPGRSEAIRQAIARELGRGYAIRVLTSGELLEYFSAQVRNAFAVIPILAVLVLGVVLAGMADTLAATVLERTRELGTARALGLRASGLRDVVIAEGVGIGLTGMLMATLCGVWLAILWASGTFRALLGWSIETALPIMPVAGIVLLTGIVCVLAILFPARHVVRMQPATALRSE